MKKVAFVPACAQPSLQGNAFNRRKRDTERKEGAGKLDQTGTGNKQI